MASAYDAAFAFFQGVPEHCELVFIEASGSRTTYSVRARSPRPSLELTEQRFTRYKWYRLCVSDDAIEAARARAREVVEAGNFEYDSELMVSSAFPREWAPQLADVFSPERDDLRDAARRGTFCSALVLDALRAAGICAGVGECETYTTNELVWLLRESPEAKPGLARRVANPCARRA